MDKPDLNPNSRLDMEQRKLLREVRKKQGWNGSYGPRYGQHTKLLSCISPQARKLRNRLVESPCGRYYGTIKQVALNLGLKPAAVYTRLKRGDSLERAFRPLDPRGGKRW